MALILVINSFILPAYFYHLDLYCKDKKYEDHCNDKKWFF